MDVDREKKEEFNNYGGIFVTKPKAWVKFENLDNNGGRFTVSPLSKGMGITIGNALRRVLLSSMPGAAITSLKIDGITHEFSTIPNVVEDVLDIICNLKGVVFKSDDSDTKLVKLAASKKGVLKASDLHLPTGIQVVNKDHHIMTLADSANINIDILVNVGIGFHIAQTSSIENSEISAIQIDSSYSPIIRVNHTVNNIRIGKELDNDELIFDVWTNGSIGIEEAVKESAQQLIYKFQLFGAINEKPFEVTEKLDEDSAGFDSAVLSMSIDDLELSARSSNCLKRAGIEAIGQLLEKDMNELIQIKNFGKKSADEINGKLSNFNLSLKG